MLSNAYPLSNLDFQMGIISILVAEIDEWSFQEVLSKTAAVRDRLGLTDAQLGAAVTGPDAGQVILLIGGMTVSKEEFETHQQSARDEQAMKDAQMAAIKAAGNGATNDDRHDATSLMAAGIVKINQRAITHDKGDGERSMAATVEAFNALTGCDLNESEGWVFLMVSKMAIGCQGGPFNPKTYSDLASFAGLTGECEAKRQRRVDAASEEMS